MPCSYDRELRDDLYLTLWKDRDGQESREARFDIIYNNDGEDEVSTPSFESGHPLLSRTVIPQSFEAESFGKRI